MRHEAIYNLYPNVVSVDDTAGAFDTNGNQVAVDEALVAAEIERLKPIKQAEQAENQRKSAYATESDPLFFKWQAGEATEAEWTAKRDEIRARYPKEQA
jgi:hypothetical protein